MSGFMDGNPFQNLNPPRVVTRRAMLREGAAGFGFLGLAGLLAGEPPHSAATSGHNPMLPKAPHFEPKAKRVIFLFMHGGPSSVDTFDFKPRLVRDHGNPLPIKRPLAFDDKEPGPLMKPMWEFRPGGESGIPVSDLFPHVRTCVDDMCIIKSMVGDGVDHGAALLQMFTGSSTFTRPSMGAWVLYGLGTENQDLPGYIMIKPALGTTPIYSQRVGRRNAMKHLRCPAGSGPARTAKASPPR